MALAGLLRGFKRLHGAAGAENAIAMQFDSHVLYFASQGRLRGVSVSG